MLLSLEALGKTENGSGHPSFIELSSIICSIHSASCQLLVGDSFLIGSHSYSSHKGAPCGACQNMSEFVVKENENMGTDHNLRNVMDTGE